MTAALHVFEWKLLSFRKQWTATLPTQVLNPLLLLLAMGIGVGSIIDTATPAGRAAFGGMSYLAFVGTGLIASSAMSVISIECCWPVLFGFVRFRSFQVMASTPVRPAHIVGGVALFAWVRAALASAGVCVVLLFVPGARSVGLVGAVFFGSVSALAFGLPLAAFAATRQGPDTFPLVQRFVVLPLTLFAGVLFPVDTLPGWLATIARVTPLWHGIELARGSVRYTLTLPTTLGHLAYLLLWITAGFVACRWTFRRRLESA